MLQQELEISRRSKYICSFFPRNHISKRLPLNITIAQFKSNGGGGDRRAGGGGGVPGSNRKHCQTEYNRAEGAAHFSSRNYCAPSLTVDYPFMSFYYVQAKPDNYFVLSSCVHSWRTPFIQLVIDGQEMFPPSSIQRSDKIRLPDSVISLSGGHRLGTSHVIGNRLAGRH